MKKNRFLAGLLAAGMMASMLTGCNGGGTDPAPQDGGDSDGGAPAASGEKTTVHVWLTGSDNIRKVYETLIEDFNTNSEYKDQYKAEMQFLLSGTGGSSMRDMLISAYKADQKDTDYDVVELGEDDLSFCVKQAGEEMLEVLDFSKIPNAEKVPAEPSMAVGRVQPYRGTTVVLAYNEDTVPEPPKTMDELVQWIKEHPGRFAYNTPGTGGAGDSFARSCVYNLIDDPQAMLSDDPKYKEEWGPGFEFLADLHPYLYKSGSSVVYPNKNQGTIDLLGQKEIDMCPAWADMILSQRKAGTIPESIKITRTDPPFNGSLVSFGVPTFGKNKDGGHAFINYVLSEKAQTILVQEMAAIPLLQSDNIDLTQVEDLNTLDVTTFRTQALGGLINEFNERWDNEIGTLG